MGATYSGEYRILYSVGCGDFVLFEEMDTMEHFDIFSIFPFLVHWWSTYLQHEPINSTNDKKLKQNLIRAPTVNFFLFL
jgi:hypothetical protein